MAAGHPGRSEESEARPLSVLAVGDSYMPVPVFAAALERLKAHGHALRFIQIDESRRLIPATVSEHRIREYAGTPDQLREQLDGVDVLLVHCAPVTEEVVVAGGQLRLVGCARGGPVNVDSRALARRLVPLATTPGKNAPAVAELTIGLMIALARGLPQAIDAVRQGLQPGSSALEGARFFGSELNGRVLGLVGFGNVGTRVAAAAAGLGMHVCFYDPYVRHPDPAGPARQLDDLTELLGSSDFVSLHARATSENNGMIDSAAFSAMKQGAFLVNTARETLIDEQSLEDALASGRLAGVALDVISPARARGRHPLLQYENVILTPHFGGATAETLARGAQMLAAEIERLGAGRQLVNVSAAGVR